ncbi:MAG: hypothetical protein KF845_13935 [Cyclobacteriaceae bacterium]|nr:hypothetical protein [Cyclobacteriaceae bacterium]
MTDDTNKPCSDNQHGEGERDYYFENGLLVFTAHYHLKRGYCCRSGCRHCPYGYEKENNTRLQKRKIY